VEAVLRLLRRAADDGHTAVAVVTVVASVGQAAVEAAVRSGAAVTEGPWLALEELATAEDAVADEVLGLAAEERLAIVLGPVPEGAEVVVVTDVHRRPLEDVAAQLQAVPDQVRVVVSGDPDALPGAAPGAVLADLLAWGALPVRDLRDTAGDGPGAGSTALAGLPAALRRGELPEPSDQSVVVVPCGSDEEVVRRAVQLVTDSVPRVFGVAASDVLVVAPLNRGGAGVRALLDALPAGTRVLTIHQAAATGERADAVVACLSGQAAGVLSRALLYSTAQLARRHLSVVTAVGAALPRAVAGPEPHPRQTRLLGLLRAAGPD
jgi:hypothetical protein